MSFFPKTTKESRDQAEKDAKERVYNPPGDTSNLLSNTGYEKEREAYDQTWEETHKAR